MKPEEIDRLFRDELEKLDHVPGIEWNEDGAWKKLNTKLKGGWNGGLTWSLSIIIVVAGLISMYTFLNPESSPIPQKNVPIVKMAVKIDSIDNAEIRKAEEVIKNKPKPKTIRTFTKPIDTVTISMMDTISETPQQPELIKPDAKSSIVYNRDGGIKLPSAKTDFSFHMPAMSLSRLKVNNNLNVSNLIRSIKDEKNAGGNLYYFYEYDKTYIPSPYGNTYQKYTIGNTHIETNFNK